MSIQKIIQEAINRNPRDLKEALTEELRGRMALALEAKMSDEEDDDEELDESWSDGINSRSQHVFAQKAKMDMQKANVARKYAKSYPTDHPQHNKNMADYHSAMAKYVKNSYHAGQYGSQSDAKPDHKEHMTAAKEYRAKSTVAESAEQIDELSKKTLGSYVGKAARDAASNAMKSGEKQAQSAEMDRMMNRHMSYDDKDKIRDIMKTTPKDVNAPRDKAAKRLGGINLAVKKLTRD